MKSATLIVRDAGKYSKYTYSVSTLTESCEQRLFEAMSVLSDIVHCSPPSTSPTAVRFSRLHSRDHCCTYAGIITQLSQWKAARRYLHEPFIRLRVISVDASQQTLLRTNTDSHKFTYLFIARVAKRLQSYRRGTTSLRSLTPCVLYHPLNVTLRASQRVLSTRLDALYDAHHRHSVNLHEPLPV